MSFRLHLSLSGNIFILSDAALKKFSEFVTTKEMRVWCVRVCGYDYYKYILLFWSLNLAILVSYGMVAGGSILPLLLLHISGHPPSYKLYVLRRQHAHRITSKNQYWIFFFCFFFHPYDSEVCVVGGRREDHVKNKTCLND